MRPVYFALARSIIASALMTLSSMQILAQQQPTSTEALTNRDVLVMVNAKLSDEVIITKIKHSRCNFDIESTQLAELKSKGVSQAVIQAMINAPYGPPVITNEVSNDAHEDGAQKVSERQDDPNAIIISRAEGAFIFRNLTVKGESYSTTLDGELVNNTSKDWLELSFSVVGLDSGGNLIPNTFELLNEINEFGLKKGETRRISKMLSGFEKQRPSRFEIKFRDGEYPALYSFVMIKPKPSEQLLYEDLYIQISFAISKRQIGFVLRNKTDDPISIDWNQVSYIDVASGSHKVMHEGVKYTSRAEPQPPSTIPPTAKLTDIVFPIDYVSYSSSRYSSGWNEEPFFPEAPQASKYKDGRFSVFMPLLINGVTKNYLFTFKIVDVQM